MTSSNTLLTHDLVFHYFNPRSRHRFGLKTTDFYLAKHILMCLAVGYSPLHLAGHCLVTLRSFEAWTWSHRHPVVFLSHFYICTLETHPFLYLSCEWLLPQFDAGPSVPHSATRKTSGGVTLLTVGMVPNHNSACGSILLGIEKKVASKSRSLDSPQKQAWSSLHCHGCQGDNDMASINGGALLSFESIAITSTCL